MSHVTSKDGTEIVFDRTGEGPALILVGGALDDGTENAPIAPELADRFTVYNYARRGRGSSGDTAPYEREREIEDLEALIAEAGGRAHVYGASSGGALALRAAAEGAPIDRLAVYEVPFDMFDGAVERHQEYTATITSLLEQDRREDALRVAMRAWGAPEEALDGAKDTPMWPGLLALAPTLAYDAHCMGTNRPEREVLGRIRQQVLVLTGGAIAEDSPMGGLEPNFFGSAADAIAAELPHGRRDTVPDQQHVVDATTFAPVLAAFFAG